MKQPQMVEIENGNLIHDGKSYLISFQPDDNLFCVKDKQSGKVLVNNNKIHNQATQEDLNKLGNFLAFAEGVLNTNCQSSERGLEQQQDKQSRGKGRSR